jgi:hypothetical protein
MPNTIKQSLLQRLPKLAVGSASVLAALYVGLSPRLAPALYNKRLFRPYAYPEGDWDIVEIAGVRREDVYFHAVDGSLLHGWLFTQKNAPYVVLFNHGNTGNITGRKNTAELLLKTGASLLMFDYRGYGKSEGKPGVREICEDGVSAFDFLVRARGYKPSEIIVYGESLGTAVAAEIAAERPCAGIILQSGFTSLRRIGQEHVPLTKLYPKFMFPSPLLDAAERMAVDEKPLLIIHGSKDQVVPLAHAKDLYERAAEPKMLVELPDCAHSDIWCTAPEQFVNAVRQFLDSLSARR